MDKRSIEANAPRSGEPTDLDSDRDSAIGGPSVDLSDQDRRIIAEANAAALPALIERGVERGLFDQFRDRVERRPDHPAIRHGDAVVSYATLHRRAEARARQLIALGVRPGDLVGLCGFRGIPLFEGMLAITAAGAGYVPIDTEFPDDRLTFMVDDAELDVVVATSDLATRFDTLPVTVHLLDQPHDEAPSTSLPAVDGRFPAYVIFTSGSTGRPKGVVTPQHAVTRLLRGSRWLDPSDDEVISQVASSSFDASTLEIWGALLAGATLAVIDKAQLIAPDQLAAALRRHGVTRWVITTAYFQQFARREPEAMGSLHAIYFGGERCDPVAIREAASPCRAAGTRLFNCYGPTETTVVATLFEVDAVDENATSVAIGRPIEDTTAHVVDARGREVGVGVPGELWLGGPRLADGYLRRPALTAERFVPDPFGGPDGRPIAGARCYRTGDLVRWLPDGQLDFLGRIDHQIKLRGFRIEPGEIEAVLARHPQVADTVVLLRQDPNREPELVAYATPAESTPRPTPILLRDYLTAALPDYMVPSAVVVLDTFPITPYGKLDRRALPAPERGQAAHRPPTTDLETSISQVWSEFLGLDRIGLDDDFFQLGGHSLVVARLISRLRETVGVELPLVALFEHSTLGELSAEVERLLANGEDGGTTPDELPPIVKVPRDGSPLPLSYPQERVWLLHQLDPTSTAYNFQMTVWFDGSLDVDALRRTLTEIVRRHEVFHCTFPAIDGEPAMVLHGPWQVDLPTADLRHVADDELDAAADRLVEAAVKTPFDVTELPLIRWQVIHLRDDRHLLIQVEHHFVHDGWSLGLLLKELKAIYPAFAAGEPSPLQDVEIQFGDFSTWQRKVIAGERLAGLVDHWKTTLDGMPTVLDLPTDHPRPNRPSTRGDARVFALPDALYSGLRAFGKEHGFTLFMTMLASFEALLYRYTGAVDLGIGSGVANRRQKAQESIIGMMVNTVVMRGDLSGDPTFAELLRRTRGVSLDAFAHQDMPFERLVEALQP
ncbi:MAG: amino acid adenylation domain-containing protein, partial [Acidobacteriota bacterium]